MNYQNFVSQKISVRYPLHQVVKRCFSTAVLLINFELTTFYRSTETTLVYRKYTEIFSVLNHQDMVKKYALCIRPSKFYTHTSSSSDRNSFRVRIANRQTQHFQIVKNDKTRKIDSDLGELETLTQINCIFSDWNVPLNFYFRSRLTKSLLCWKVASSASGQNNEGSFVNWKKWARPLQRTNGGKNSDR